MELLLFIIITSVTAGFGPVRGKVRSNAPLAATKEATFGMGCFWKPAEELLKTNGVVDTVAGYTGKPSATSVPSYDDVCFGREWVEGVRVYYDDEQLSYRQLLDAFFEAQEPKLGSRQYASIVFPHDAEQQLVVEDWLSSEKERRRADGIPVGLTTVEPLSKFYQAEGYHQKYWAKQRPRFATIIALVALSSGMIDDLVPELLLSRLHSGANAVALAISVYVMLERVIDAKVFEI